MMPYQACPVKYDIPQGLGACFCTRRNVRPPKLRSPSRKAKKSRPFRGPFFVQTPCRFLHRMHTALPVLDVCSVSQEVHRIGDQSTAQLLVYGSRSMVGP